MSWLLFVALIPLLIFAATSMLPGSRVLMLSNLQKTYSLPVLELRSFAAKRVGLLNHLQAPVGYAVFFPNTKTVHTSGMHCSIALVFLDHDFRVISFHRMVFSNLRIQGPKGTKHTLELSLETLEKLDIKQGERLFLTKNADNAPAFQ